MSMARVKDVLEFSLAWALLVRTTEDSELICSLALGLAFASAQVQTFEGRKEEIGKDLQ